MKKSPVGTRARFLAVALPVAAAILSDTATSGANLPISSPGQTAVLPIAHSYADLVDLLIPATTVVRARVVEMTALDESQSAGRPPGTNRYYFVGTTTALIRGSEGVAPQISWLADVALDVHGRPPKLKKTELLLAATPVAARPGELRLVARDAMQPWSAEYEARLRAVIAELLARDAPPTISGVVSAFHVAGTLAGESETQFFLSTPGDRPVSITVLRRLGQTPRWAVALGEIVDEAAAPPRRDTLGWYRLACGLPRALPAFATADLPPEDADSARADFRYVLGALGPCARTRR